ncbi:MULTISPECIES: M16 family metallopeptidase [Stutzerimonas stutzeri group]|uniref:Peptidase M16 n=1 Tax=Stutzerimonas degradans TaxID=2968968 RepID=A0A8E2U0V7_9GAMM|nr:MULTISPECIES: pitrilysin family protein [Stutzerimonas stutzeri group]MCQ4276407.1 insulinase family protein [Stutzerimonas degradans]NHW02817.1 insulinase family protein [Stutzerimonas degradans]PNF75850.1 peptidase M16 [Stutzerimonas degradans]QPT20677.1 insulinase family protein [Stutzerimonas degradans]UVO18376.1 insulinase family protein [Stutzerimonas stutzeri]
MHLTLRRAAALLLGALYLPLVAATDSQPTHEFFLDNGLKVIVREDHRAPVVVSQLWYKVGSSYETPGQTGLSHALEHMMFKGSRKLGPGEASRILRELGAEENAFTSDDYTAYYQVLARDRLAVAFELEADRLASLKLPVEEFTREIEVIKEERRLRTDDKPNALAFERFKTVTYPASGYRNPTIGWMADLERMQADELRAWYEQWYAPNNATLVVVGDVTQDEVRGLAERYFGPIAKRPLPSAKAPLELDEPGERRLQLHVNTQLPTLLMAFNVPSLSTKADARQIHALRLIAALLDGGYSARLPERLERGEELVTSASAWYNAYARGDSLFMLSAVPNVQKGRSLADVESRLWAELDLLKQHAPSREELERVRAQVIAGLVYERDSITQQATTIGQLETVGLSWRLMDDELAALEAVTPEDIQQAARTYFTPTRLSVAHVLPEESADE